MGWMKLVEQVMLSQNEMAPELIGMMWWLIIIFGVVLILWAIMELISSLVFRKNLADIVHATLTSVSTSINVNTQYLTDALIKLAQLGHAERIEHLRTQSLMTNETFTTARMAIALDQLKDLVKAIEKAGESE